MKNLALFITFLFTIPVFAQTTKTPAFELSSSDVSECELFLFESGRNMAGFLRISYSQEKGAEFSKIASENPQKKFNIVLNGKIASDITVTKPEKGQFLDLKRASPEEVFEIAKALVNPPTKPAPDFEKTADAQVFSIAPSDVLKGIISMSKDGTVLELTIGSEKAAEYVEITTDYLPKQLKIILNDKIVSEQTITKPASGNVVKIPMHSPDEAFEMAKALNPQGHQDTAKTPNSQDLGDIPP